MLELLIIAPRLQKLVKDTYVFYHFSLINAKVMKATRL